MRCGSTSTVASGPDSPGKTSASARDDRARFRAFLAMLPERVELVQAGGPDLTVKLIEEPRKPEPKQAARTRTRKS